MKSKYKVIYTPEASEDLRSIYYHIAKRLFAPIAARNQVNRIRKEIRDLDIFPSRYAFIEWEPWHSMGVHCFPVDNYSVLYAINIPLAKGLRDGVSTLPVKYITDSGM